jgi:oligopeptide/dipeptide ABC transporter ATP-binding protein
MKKTLSRLFERNYKNIIRAVNDISFDIQKGEILSLVGESGSGKTTTGRALLRLIKDVDGEVCYNGNNILKYSKSELKAFRSKAQMIFQDPYQSLNPRQTIAQIVGESLEIHYPKVSLREKNMKIVRALEWCGLKPVERFWNRFPHELSGGQRQRVAIAGALILEPELIIADEPVSMLDASVRLDILNLLNALRDEIGVTCLFITHDLALAWLISDRIAVMYSGRIVESGPAQLIAGGCAHPYSKALIAALPSVSEVQHKKRVNLTQRKEDFTAVNACPYIKRCEYAVSVCETAVPRLRAISEDHLVACHLLNQKE